MSRNSSQHARSDFLFLVKRPDVVGKFGITMPKFHVGTRLRNSEPTDLEKRFKYSAGPGAGPLAHADRQPMLIDLGTSRDFSISSAIDRKASA